MFYHLYQVGKGDFEFDGYIFEIQIFRANEDGHLRGYISSGQFSDVIVEMHGDTANDMKHCGGDPVEVLIRTIKDEITAGKFNIEAS